MDIYIYIYAHLLVNDFRTTCLHCTSSFCLLQLEYSTFVDKSIHIVCIFVSSFMYIPEAPSPSRRGELGPVHEIVLVTLASSCLLSSSRGYGGKMMLV